MTTHPSSIALPKKEQATLFTTGLALFSMFFGAGNLIFPLLIGKSVGTNVWHAIAGLGLTAVLVPFIGIITMILFQGDYNRFFGRLGKIPGLFLLGLLQLILGPFGVIPRLVTLMQATAEPYLFNMPPIAFNSLIVALIFGLSFQRHKLVRFLGALTPVLLICIGALLVTGFMTDFTFNPAGSSPQESFFQGLVGGYNTMDLIAAFMFATVVLPHFQQDAGIEFKENKQRLLLKKILVPSSVAASLLFLTYVGLCLISAAHGWKLAGSYPPEQLLSAIAIKLLGKTGGFIAAFAVIIACLTTAMSLAVIFSEYLRVHLCKEKISPSLSLAITLAITLLFTNLGFGGIAAVLSPVLQIVYPGLILLTVLNLLYLLYGYRPIKWPVFLTFGATAIIYLM